MRFGIGQRAVTLKIHVKEAEKLAHAIQDDARLRERGDECPPSEITRNAECESEAASPPQSSLCNGIEAQLTQYQNQVITDTLCRLVAEQGHLPHELPDFRRALIDECLAMNAKTSGAALKNADSRLATQIPAKVPDVTLPNKPGTEAAESSTNPSWFARVSSDRRKISIFLITTPTTAKELVFQLPLTIDCLVEQEHLPKPLLEFLTWCAKT
jgi:hypothetical protein